MQVKSIDRTTHEISLDEARRIHHEMAKQHAANAQAINATNARINAITKVVVPGDVVCGDRCGRCAGGNGNQQ